MNKHLQYKIKQLSHIILKNESSNLQQKPVFYASYFSGSWQLVLAIVTVWIASQYGVSSYISDILCNTFMVSGI
jgi:hypothetical protein